MEYDLIIKGGSCLLPGQKGELTESETDIGISAGLIKTVGALANRPAARTLDAKGLHVLPGLMDTQVHFREPGMAQKEDLASGTAGAVKGGITAVFEMPNTYPPTTDARAFAEKVNRAHDRVWCHIAFYIGATKDNAQNLGELEKLDGCAGVKMFMGSSTGNLLVGSDSDIEQVVRNGRRRMASHCEDEERLRERKHLVDENPGRVELHPLWRDEETALRATQKLISIANKYQRPVHILHVTTLQEIAFLKDYKTFASVEVTPQHLTLAAPECYERLGTLAQMNPPIRTGEHREALWKGIRDGVIDIIGSDHAPHTLEEKRQVYPNTPSGMTGVQTLVPVMLNHIAEGRLSLKKLVELLTLNPVRLFNIRNKGRLQAGFDADITLVDLKKSRVIENNWIESRCGWTPFAGTKVQGWPIATIIQGNIVMQEDQIIGRPCGSLLSFER